MTAMAKEVTDIAPAGDTPVDARILSDGDVSYIVSIPEKIDFGTLQMPADAATSHEKPVEFKVEAVEIEGLNTNTSRVAVLMKDGTEGNTDSEKFILKGISDTNNGKTLTYDVLGADTNKTNITTGTKYSNGYLFTAFSKAGQSATGTLSLEQNQLRDDPILANWAGNYQGIINFYTAIASVGDFNSSATTE